MSYHRRGASSPAILLQYLVASCCVFLQAGTLMAQGVPGNTFMTLPAAECGYVERLVDSAKGEPSAIICADNSSAGSAVNGTQLYSLDRKPDGSAQLLWSITAPGVVKRATQLAETQYVADCGDAPLFFVSQVRVLDAASGQLVGGLYNGSVCQDLLGINLTVGSANPELLYLTDHEQIDFYRFDVATKLLIPVYNFTPASIYKGIKSLANLKDLNNNGEREWALGAPLTNMNGKADIGAVMIHDGDPRDDLPSQVKVYLGKAAGDRFGVALASMPDLDGDGELELVVGAPGGRYVDVINAISGQVIMHIHRPNLDSFGVSLDASDDVNGDNVADILVRHANGMRLISGRDGSNLISYPAAQGHPQILGKAADQDKDKIFASFVAGTDVVLGDQWGCPAFQAAKFSDGGVFGDGGFEPKIEVHKGCFVKGGQMKIELGKLSPSKPYLLQVTAAPAAVPGNIKNGGINKVLGDRKYTELFEIGVAGSVIPNGTFGDGVMSHIVRDLQPNDVDNDGVLEWYLQTFGFGQVYGHPQGAGISSSDLFYIMILP